jgi:hypothetical protein
VLLLEKEAAARRRRTATGRDGEKEAEREREKGTAYECKYRAFSLFIHSICAPVPVDSSVVKVPSYTFLY